jgi:hypothetical protein
MVSEDEYLERIVAGIHAVSTADADVQWNEKINGRQFDVVVRFKLGTLSYLVLVEVRNRTRRAEASDIEGFVTKAADQNASKAVFVTAAGFQQGAIEVAKRHGVELFTVTFDETGFHVPTNASILTLAAKGAPKNMTPSLSVGELKPIIKIEEVKLIFADKTEYDFPEEHSQVTYYCKQTKFTDGRTLEDLIEKAPIPEVKLEETKPGRIDISPPQRIRPPDEYYFPKGKLAAVTFKVTGGLGRPIHSNILIDPNIFTLPVVYTNALTGEELRYELDQLPLGPKLVEVGKFYFVNNPLLYYYCASIDGDEIRWHLVESFQNGNLLTATMTQHVKYSSGYIPVRDKKILKRLKRRLDDYLKREK